MFKILNKLTPEYLQDLFKPFTSEYDLRGKANKRAQRTPLQKAERQEHHSIVQLLLKNDPTPSLLQPVRYQTACPIILLANLVFQMKFAYICYILCW